MTLVTGIYALVVLALAYFALTNAGFKTDKQRFAMVLLVTTVLVTSYGAFLDVMGRPRPAKLTMLSDEYQLLQYVSDKKYIYLWVRAPGKTEPLSLSVEFDPAFARKLRAAQEGTADGDHVILERNRDTDEAEWVAHPPTYEENPPKTDESWQRRNE